MGQVVGMDIGSYAIKVAAVNHGFNKVELQALAAAYNPLGQTLPVDEAGKTKLATTIKQLLSEQKIATKQVYAALPESMAYTIVVTMPNLSDAELASSIHWEAEQHIPVPLDEVNLEYQILYKPQKGEETEKMRVLLVAAKKDLIAQLVELYHLAGVEVVGLETTLLSVERALHSTMANIETSMVCHIGALSCDILIMHKGEVVLTYTVPSGGLALTRAIEKNLNLPPQQAEEYKRAYGMDPTQLEGKVRQVLTPGVNVLIAEIRKALQYYQTSHVMNNVRSMLVTGGTAYLPGLAAYMAENFGYEVTVANPSNGLPFKHGLALPENPAVFTPAIGLALRPE